MIFENMLRIRGYELKKTADFLGSTPEYPENGTEFGDSAVTKVNAFVTPMQRAKSLRGQRFAVFATEFSLNIHGCSGMPGRYSRIWRDLCAKTAPPHEMPDEENLSFILEQCAPLGTDPAARTATASTFLTMIGFDEEGLHGSMRWTASIEGRILCEPVPERILGLPIASIFHMDSCNMTLAELYTDVSGYVRKTNKDYHDSLDRAFDQAVNQAEALLKGRQVGY